MTLLNAFTADIHTYAIHKYVSISKSVMEKKIKGDLNTLL
jgi:hypothetical protein